MKNNITPEEIQESSRINESLLPSQLAKVLKFNDSQMLNNLLIISLQNPTEKIINIFTDFLFHCCEFGKKDLIKILLQKKFIDVDSVDSNGDTMLHILASKGEAESIRELLRYNPKKDIINSEGYTAYDYAAESGNEEIKQLLYDSIKENGQDKTNKFSIPHTSYERNCITDRNYIERTLKLEEMKMLLEKEKNDAESDGCNLKDSESENRIHLPGGNTKIDRDCQINNVIANNRAIKYKDLFYFDTEPNNDECKDKVKKVSARDKNENYLSTSCPIKENEVSTNTNELFPIIENESNSKIFYDESDKKTISLEQNSEARRDSKINKLPLSLILNPLKGKEKSNSAIEFPSSALHRTRNQQIFELDQHYNTTDSGLFLFLKEIGLSQYSNVLYQNGFDDIGLLVSQTKKGIAITNKNLLDMGIAKIGERGKILVKIEEKAGLFHFIIDKEKVYQNNVRNTNALYRMLVSIKMENYFDNFIKAGYSSPDLLYIQMITRQPLTESDLEREIGIDKIGYRMRLLNKIKTEGEAYGRKMNRSVCIETKKNEDEFCNMCIIY